jgi:hypothetical protein
MVDYAKRANLAVSCGKQNSCIFEHLTEKRLPLPRSLRMSAGRKSILAVGDSLTAGFCNGGDSFRPYTLELEVSSLFLSEATI